MAQARVLEPESSPYAEGLKRIGFHYCRKDGRWEKNCSKPAQILEPVIEEYPGIKTEVSQSDA